MDFAADLVARARQRPCTVALPEATEARVLRAAARAQQDGIAECLLLGEAAQIHAAARAAALTLPDGIRIMQPDSRAYVETLIQLRAQRGKPLDGQGAAAMLDSPVALAAMLVQDGTAAAMVAGAVTTSAAVLRPALQIVGLQPGAALASAAFLMCFADGMRVFADCALNIAPDAEQLATIAAQSAETARAFGLAPVVAMLSYSSGGSGNGEEVARVGRAADLLRQRLPDAPIAGPIQYDAAVSPTVAKIKLPDSPAAGRANVLVFPDLNAGNIAYKAVQQTGALVCIGPLMQGLAAPVNDLSRGASADDIYYTIAATAVQAQRR